MPWYTTADARRDAEKQSADKKRRYAMSYTFEVEKSGAVKATNELGAVELVPHWTWHAVALRQLIAERDTLRARLAAIDNAPTVARSTFVRGEICGCQTRPTHYVGEIDCPWHKRGDGQPKEPT